MSRSHRPCRRAFLATGAGTLVAPLAGCTRISEFVVDAYVGDINLFNTTDRRLTGSLELLGPDDRVLLDEDLDLGPDDADGDPAAIYDNVLATPGPHGLTLAIDGTTRGDPATVKETRQIDDPGEQQVVVLLGERFTDEFVTVTVVEDFAELDGIIED